MRTALLRLMIDRIQHAALLTYDNGQRTFDLPVQRRARIDRSTRQIRNAAGEFVNSEALVFIEGPVLINERDALLMQNDTPTDAELLAAAPIIKVDHVSDIDGTISHAEVFV